MVDVAAGADTAVVSWPVPNKCEINSVNGDVHIVGNAAVDHVDVVAYGFEGWMLQTEAIESDFADQNVIWDTSVPKDDGSEVLDTSFVADSDTMFEPGAVNAAQMFGQELLQPQRIYKREELISFASSPIGFEVATATYIPRDTFKVNMNGKYRAGFDGALVFGVGSPDWGIGINNNVVPVLGTIQKSLYAMAHIDDVIDKAMIDFLVLTETGAESPYDDIMTWLMALLDQKQSAGSAGSFTGITFVVTTKMIAGIAVPGTITGRTLGPDMQAS